MNRKTMLERALQKNMQRLDQLLGYFGLASADEFNQQKNDIEAKSHSMAHDIELHIRDVSILKGRIAQLNA